MTLKLTDPDARQAAFDAVLRCDPQAFVRKSFVSVFPSNDYKEPRHLAVLSSVLLKIFKGEVHRLIVNIPPRLYKSFTITVCFAAWYLGHFPGAKILIVSHDKALAMALADQIHSIMRSEWYIRAFNIEIRDDFDRQMHFQTQAGGGVIATSIEAGITGQGADLLIFDDPLDAGDAYRGLARRRVNELYESKFATRLNSQAEGIVLVVQQRLHPEDLSGYLLAKGGYERLKISLVATEDEAYETEDGVWARPKGDVLDSSNYPADVIAKLQCRPDIYSANYQQEPVLQNTGLVRRECFPILQNLPRDSKQTTLSFDLAHSANEGASYSCCLIFSTDGGYHNLCQSLRIRSDYPEVKAWAIKLIDTHQPASVLIEKAAFGVPLIPELHKLGKNVTPIDLPSESKTERLVRHLELLNSGRVRLVSPGMWHPEFLDEVVSFPNGDHSDQVDALTQYLDWVNATPSRPPAITLGVSGHPTDRYAARISRPRKPGDPHPMRDPRNGWPPRRF